MDYSSILEQIVLYLGIDESEAEKYQILINNEILSIEESLNDTSDVGDSRLATLCALRVCCKILLLDGNNNITSFTASDISYSTDSSNTIAYIKELIDDITAQCGDLICDESFAFLDV